VPKTQSTIEMAMTPQPYGKNNNLILAPNDQYLDQDVIIPSELDANRKEPPSLMTHDAQRKSITEAYHNR